MLVVVTGIVVLVVVGTVRSDVARLATNERGALTCVDAITRGVSATDANFTSTVDALVDGAEKRAETGSAVAKSTMPPILATSDATIALRCARRRRTGVAMVVVDPEVTVAASTDEVPRLPIFKCPCVCSMEAIFECQHHTANYETSTSTQL